MITAIYARVSTDDKGQDPLNQVMQMPVHELEFVDYASGKNGDREQFRAMLAAAERHEFDALVFWSFDRLTREGALETLLYLKKLDDLGIAWRSLTEPYLDSCGPFKDVMVAMIATAAKMERERLSARTKAGMRRVMTHGTASGNPVGRPKANLEGRCRELRATGLSLKRMGMKRNVSPAYVHKAVGTAVLIIRPLHRLSRNYSVLDNEAHTKTKYISFVQTSLLLPGTSSFAVLLTGPARRSTPYYREPPHRRSRDSARRNAAIHSDTTA